MNSISSSHLRVGTIITALLLVVLKKDAKKEDAVVLDVEEEELDLSGIKIS